ncbi:MAG: branched-chain amino acid ABC transporter permease [Terriglobales bacterium]
MRKLGLALAAVIALAAVPLVVHNHFLLHLSIMVLLYALLGMSWNLLGGYTGQISFGHAAFFGTGAYTSTILLLRFGISPWLGMFVGAVLAVLLSLPLGWLTFRLRGPYFALATLAFAEVVRVIVFNWDSLTGGGDGLNILTDLGGIVRFYYIILALTVAGVLVLRGFIRSRWGYFLNAIREDEDAAEALGVPATRIKVIVLAVSAFFVALGGSFFASYQLYINPDLVYESQISIQMIVVCIVGGIGTLEGPIVGALVLVPLSEYFRGLSPVANPLIYGLFIVIFMLFLPEGIVSRVRRLIGPTVPIRLATEALSHGEKRG